MEEGFFMPSVVCSFGVRADDSRHGEIEERSFVAKSAPPSCAAKDVGYGGQAG
jgi:hypothetical protein